MTYEEAIQTIPLGRYRHFKGKPYEVLAIARHSETEEAMEYVDNIKRAPSEPEHTPDAISLARALDKG